MTEINFKTLRIDEDKSAWNNDYQLCIHVLDADNDKWKIVLIFARKIVSDCLFPLPADEDTVKKKVIEKLKTKDEKLLITLIEQAIKDQKVQEGLQGADRRGVFYVPEEMLGDYRN